MDHGANVINLSLGSSYPSNSVEQAIAYAQSRNVVVIAAAGNQGSDAPFYPAAIPSVIAVGGTDQNDARWVLSNHGDFVDVVAPAVSIYSTYYDASAGSSTYAYMNGTSMSTAFVSGLAALALSRRPEATSDQVIAMMTERAIDLGAAGKDPEYGYGRTDAYNTMIAANDGVIPIIDPDDEPEEEPDDKGSGDGEEENTDQPLSHALYLPAIAKP